MKKYFSPGFMRTLSLVVVFTGALGSLCLVLYKGRNNESFILIGLFEAWVLSPFIALLIAAKLSKHWTDLSCKRLYTLMIVLTIVSLIIYSGVLSPAGTKTAFVFLVIPLISWVLIVLLLLIARSQSK